MFQVADIFGCACFGDEVDVGEQKSYFFVVGGGFPAGVVSFCFLYDYFSLDVGVHVFWVVEWVLMVFVDYLELILLLEFGWDVQTFIPGEAVLVDDFCWLLCLYCDDFVFELDFYFEDLVVGVERYVGVDLQVDVAQSEAAHLNKINRESIL